MKILKIVCLFMLIFSGVYGQKTTSEHFATTSSITRTNLKIPRLNLGAEIQWYPDGWIYGARADLYLGKHVNWNFRIAYKNVNRKDISTYNLQEKGGGFGGSLGYRYFLDKRKGLFFGGRADVWDLNINWQDVDANMNAISGTTMTTVFQPTVEIGYQFVINKHWSVAPAFTNGFEINVKTTGDIVHHGFVTLIGVNLAYKLF